MENKNVSFSLNWSVNIPNGTAKAFIKATVELERERRLKAEALAANNKSGLVNSFGSFFPARCSESKDTCFSTNNSEGLNTLLTELFKEYYEKSPTKTEKTEKSCGVNTTAQFIDTILDAYNAYINPTKKSNESTTKEESKQDQSVSEGKESTSKTGPVVEAKEATPKSVAEEECKESTPKKTCPPPESYKEPTPEKICGQMQQDELMKLVGPMFSMLTSALNPNSKEGVQTPTPKVMDDFSFSNTTETILKKVEKEEKETCIPSNGAFDKKEIADILGKGGYVD